MEVDANAMTGFLVINPRSGQGAKTELLRSEARRLGIETHASNGATRSPRWRRSPGEPTELETPLRLEIEPQALRVLLPETS
jgi:diacylglycerol kinase family enzyme